MPYSSISELPDAVKDRYSPRCQKVFLDAFNAANGDEAAKFKVAHTAAGMCKDAGKAESDLSPMKAAPLDPDLMDAWWAGKVARPMLAIPFSGPIAGKDMDREFFTERTDVKADWFTERPMLWHHGTDPTGYMGTRTFGKAVNPTMEEDGWWVDVWLKAGEARLATIRRLAEKAEQAGSGVQLYGSSAAIPHLVKRNTKSGHIDIWPWWEQTLSTSPQNTHSVLRSAKAVLQDFDHADIDLPSALKAALVELDALRSDLPAPSGMGEQAAKAGRELSGATLSEMDEWYEALADVAKRLDAIRGRVRSKYEPKE